MVDKVLGIVAATVYASFIVTALAVAVLLLVGGAR